MREDKFHWTLQPSECHGHASIQPCSHCIRHASQPDAISSSYSAAQLLYNTCSKSICIFTDLIYILCPEYPFPTGARKRLACPRIQTTCTPYFHTPSTLKLISPSSSSASCSTTRS